MDLRSLSDRKGSRQDWPRCLSELKDNDAFLEALSYYSLTGWSARDTVTIALRKVGREDIVVTDEDLKDLGRSPEMGKAIRHTRTSLNTPYITRLEGHLDELARLRDLAVDEGLIGVAVAAEVSRGKAQGFYSPNSPAVVAAGEGRELSKMSNEEMIAALKTAVASSPVRTISGADIDRHGREVIDIVGEEVIE